MSVMLATQSKAIAPTPVEAIEALQATEEWFFEMKWDGVRCLARRHEDGEITLTNRRGDDITDRFPEITETMGSVHDGQFLLDGEIVVFGNDGRPDFNLLAKRKVGNPKRSLALAKSLPAFFMAFDVLELDGHRYADAPYAVRREVLATLNYQENHVVMTPSRTDGKTMWEFVETHKLEGLVAKFAYSPWIPQRSPTWIKMRRTLSASCLVRGYQPGKGKHEGLVGALLLSVIDGETGEIIDCGKVGTGFTDKQRESLLALFDNEGAPQRNMIAEVEFQELTPDGVLRFPSYRGLRDDLQPEDCTMSQLTTTREAM